MAESRTKEVTLDDAKALLEGPNPDFKSFLRALPDQKDAPFEVDEMASLEAKVRMEAGENQLKPEVVDSIVALTAIIVGAHKISDPNNYIGGEHGRITDTSSPEVRGRAAKKMEGAFAVASFLISSVATYLGTRGFASGLVEGATEAVNYQLSATTSIILTELSAIAAGTGLAKIINGLKQRSRDGRLENPGPQKGYLSDLATSVGALFTKGLRRIGSGGRTAVAATLLTSLAAFFDAASNAGGGINAISYKGDIGRQIADVSGAVRTKIDTAKESLSALTTTVIPPVEQAIKDKLLKEERGEGTSGSPGKGPLYNAIDYLNTGSAAARANLEAHAELGPKFLSVIGESPGFFPEFKKLVEGKSTEINAIAAEMEGYLKDNITADTPIEQLKSSLAAIDGPDGYLAKIQEVYNQLIAQTNQLIEKYNKLEGELAKAAVGSKKYPNAKAGKVVEFTIPSIAIDDKPIELGTDFIYKDIIRLTKDLIDTKAPGELALIVILALLGAMLASYGNVLFFPPLLRNRRLELEDIEKINSQIKGLIERMSLIFCEFLNQGFFSEFFKSKAVTITPELMSKTLYDVLDKQAAALLKENAGKYTSPDTATAAARLQVLQGAMNRKTAINFATATINTLLPGTRTGRIRHNDAVIRAAQDELSAEKAIIDGAITAFRTALPKANTSDEAQKIVDQHLARVNGNGNLTDAAKAEFATTIADIVEANRDLLRRKTEELAKKNREDADTFATLKTVFVKQIANDEVKRNEFKDFAVKLVDLSHDDISTERNQLITNYLVSLKGETVGNDTIKITQLLIASLDELLKACGLDEQTYDHYPELLERLLKEYDEAMKLNVNVDAPSVSTTLPPLEPAFASVESPKTVTDPSKRNGGFWKATGQVLGAGILTAGIGHAVLGDLGRMFETGDTPIAAPASAPLTPDKVQGGVKGEVAKAAPASTTLPDSQDSGIESPAIIPIGVRRTAEGKFLFYDGSTKLEMALDTTTKTVSFDRGGKTYTAKFSDLVSATKGGPVIVVEFK